jgi:Flp pilus assembly protein TadD
MKNVFWLLMVVISGLGLVGCSSTGGSKSTTGSEKHSESDSDSVEQSKTNNGESGGLGEVQGAVENLPSKKDLYDGIQISLGSGDDALVEKSVANLLSQDQGDSKALNSLALYHYSKGRDHLARMIFKSMLERDPNNFAAHSNLGVLYSRQGDQRKAIESFKRAISANPDYGVANANLGCIFAVGKDYGKARGLLAIAYKSGIRDLAVLNNYAISLMAEGDSDAEKIFKEALQIGASDSGVSFNYALYLTYVKKDYKDAGEVLDKLRFMGVPPQKKALFTKIEEIISGRGSDESKSP